MRTLRSVRSALLLLLLLTAVAPLALQALQAQGGATTLSLDEAIGLAKRNNPSYLQLVNSRTRADANLRAAYGSFMPTASTNLGTGFRQGKQEIVSGVAFGSTSDILSSSWGLNVSYNFSARTLTNLRAARAAIEAADADIANANQQLRSVVVQEYVAVLQRQAQAALQDTLVVFNQLQLDLAKAKAGVGTATSLDVIRAEVALGTQQVAALRAHNDENVERLRLYQQLGVPAVDNVTLNSTLPITEPSGDLAQLLGMAQKTNASLLSLRQRQVVADQSFRAAQGGYLPTFFASAGLGGSQQKYTDVNYLLSQGTAQAASAKASCFTQDSLRRGAGMPGISSCGAISFSAAQADAVRASNSQWPFSFNSNPLTLSFGVSLNLFDGFNRERTLQSAAADQSDARYNIRAQELKLTADVSQAFSTLSADFRVLKLQDQNSTAARQALQLAQERYRVGLNSLVDLQQARADFDRAETDRINSIFEYHRAFAALESAVGRPLR
jgi:outer membrane protein